MQNASWFPYCLLTLLDGLVNELAFFQKYLAFRPKRVVYHGKSLSFNLFLLLLIVQGWQIQLLSRICIFLTWNGELVLSSSHFLLMTHLPHNMLLISKVVKIDPKIVIFLLLPRKSLNPGNTWQTVFLHFKTTSISNCLFISSLC